MVIVAAVYPLMYLVNVQCLNDHENVSEQIDHENVKAEKQGLNMRDVLGLNSSCRQADLCEIYINISGHYALVQKWTFANSMKESQDMKNLVCVEDEKKWEDEEEFELVEKLGKEPSCGEDLTMEYETDNYNLAFHQQLFLNIEH